MTLFNSLLLGVVQGLTEFLPVSSSGHLILARELLGIQTQSGLAFDAVLQLGTTVAVIIYFRKTIYQLCCDALLCIAGRGKDVRQEDKNLLICLIIGTLPALVLGLMLEKTMETIFRNPLWVAAGLFIGSILFFMAEKFARQRQTLPTTPQSVGVGFFQALALLPGMSRSGSTISGGLLFGLNREAATRFSFLLSLPIIAGSGLKKLFDIVRHGNLDTPLFQLAVGCFVAGIVGWFCIDFLLRYLKNHTLYAFIAYRLTVAVIILFVFWR